MSTSEAPTTAGKGLPPTGQAVTAAVAMAPGRPAGQTVAGTLSFPPGRTPDTVQVLIPGGTYGQAYWSVRGRPGRPSYVEAMNAAGYATLAVDRLGTGRSSCPHSSQFTDQTHEDVIHQVICQLRDGVLGGHQFSQVILAGNSFGSTIARMVAVRYPDAVDGLILTGESSTPNLAAFQALEADYHPASQDPRLAGRGLDDGYIVIKPGGKAAWFYHQPTADPAVVAADEAAAEPDVYPADPEYGSPSLDSLIKAPVLIMVGDHDKLMCGQNATACSSSSDLLAAEQRAYGGNRRVEAAVIKDTGHVLNTHGTAPASAAVARDWADRHIGALAGGAR